MNQKRGLSTVVSVMILVLLVMVLISIVWVMVSNIVNDVTEETENCFGIFDQVRINNKFTCYNASSDEVHFSLEIGEINLSKVIVSVASNNDSSVFELTNDLTNITNLRHYESPGPVKLPSQLGSRTYIANNFINKPKLIQVAPVVGKTTCDVSDSLNEINDCSSLA